MRACGRACARACGELRLAAHVSRHTAPANSTAANAHDRSLWTHRSERRNRDLDAHCRHTPRHHVRQLRLGRRCGDATAVRRGLAHLVPAPSARVRGTRRVESGNCSVPGAIVALPGGYAPPRRPHSTDDAACTAAGAGRVRGALAFATGGQEAARARHQKLGLVEIPSRGGASFHSVKKLRVTFCAEFPSC